jgi:hypothetical protein
MPQRELSVRNQNSTAAGAYTSDDQALDKAKADLEAARKELDDLKSAQKSGSGTASNDVSKLEAQVKEANEKVAAAETELKKKDNENKKAMDKLKNDLLGFAIQYKHSNKCLEVENSSNVDGARLRQQACNGSSSQKFRLIERTSGNWVQNLGTGKCLSAQANGTGNGTQVVQATCVDNGAMLNNLLPDGNGFYFIRNAGSNRCVDIEAISQADGAGAQIFDCLNGDAQRVKLIPANS